MSISDDIHVAERLAAVRGRHVSGGRPLIEDSMEARTHAFLHRHGVHVEHPHRDAHMYRGHSLLDHGRDFCEARGERVGSTEPVTIWQRNFEAYRSGLGGVDLPGLVTNIGRVGVLAGWSSAPVSYPAWTRTGTLSTLRQEARTGLTSFPTLPKVPEHGEIQNADRSTVTEYVTGSRYVSTIDFSDHVLLGDSGGAMAREAQAIGRAARATVEKACVDLLVSNSGVGPTMNQDATALFHVNHGNYISSSGAAPSVSTLDAARKAMRTRPDPTSGEVLNVVPRVLLVPAALETVGRVLVASNNTPLGDQEGDLTVAVCPRLDSTSATAWYLTGDPSRFDTIEVAYIDGRDEPEITTAKGWTVDGSRMKVALNFGVAALDYRAMYRNVGA
jgi:hypothetical protein